MGSGGKDSEGLGLLNKNTVKNLYSCLNPGGVASVAVV